MMNDGIDKCSFGKERREEGHAVVGLSITGLSSSVFLPPVLPAVTVPVTTLYNCWVTLFYTTNSKF